MDLVSLGRVAVAAAAFASLRGDESKLALVEAARAVLPDVAGRIDHCAYDAKRDRLFVAAIGNGSIEVVEWPKGVPTGRVAGRVRSLDEPQGVAYLADADELAFTTGGDGKLHVHDGTTLKEKRTLAVGGDADNVRFEPNAKQLLVGVEDGLAIVDTAKCEKVATVALAGHAESFQLEPDGVRVYVNVPSARHVAVVDLKQRKVVATWSLGDASSNFPMALDAKAHRLFVGCRSPARLLVLDTTNGQRVAKLAIGGDCDDLFLDSTRESDERVYASCGSGVVSMFLRKADVLDGPRDVTTAPGARTSLFVPSVKRLFVVVPARGDHGAEVRAMELQDPSATR